MKVTMELNGEETTFEVDGWEPLLDVLRREGFTGQKRGCRSGSCGFCTVLINGKAEKSCLFPIETLEDASVETIEGLGTQDELHPIQQAFVENNALQCGFCIPGMIMRSKGVLQERTRLSRDEIRQELSDNLCRCTGYEKIIKAVQEADSRWQRSEPAGTVSSEQTSEQTTGGEGA